MIYSGAAPPVGGHWRQWYGRHGYMGVCWRTSLWLPPCRHGEKTWINPRHLTCQPEDTAVHATPSHLLLPAIHYCKTAPPWEGAGMRMTPLFPVIGNKYITLYSPNRHDPLLSTSLSILVFFHNNFSCPLLPNVASSRLLCYSLLPSHLILSCSFSLPCLSYSVFCYPISCLLWYYALLFSF